MLLFKSIFLLVILLFTYVQSKKLEALDWWQTSIIYQIYPRSFKDINGDGVGDIKGIINKLTYLKNLGIDSIWLSPIFKSPMVDFGYDIADFKDIEPIFGTITDVTNLISECNKIDMKVIMDFVPNHASNEHIWFQKSVQKIAPYTDYFIWKDAKIINGVRHPPNNWLSVFGGSAWEWNDKRQQYYYHAFAYQQVDLNYRNKLVIEEMKNIFRYWIEKGVDGLRIDSVPYLFEDIELRDEPVHEKDKNEDIEPTDHDYLEHIYTLNQNETYELIYDFRELMDSMKLIDGKTRFMMAEAYSSLESMLKYYGDGNRNGAHFPFNFVPITTLNRQSSAKDFAASILSWETKKPKGKWSNWVIGNHDQKRAASRFDAEFIDGLNMMILLLPGTAITYNGDELGMEDSFIRWDQTVDPQALNVGEKRYQAFSRDFSRSPFHWNSEPNAGFTTNLYSWLPVNPNYWYKNLAVERKNPRSHFHVYKSLAKLRRTATMQRGNLDVYVLSEWTLCFVRSFGDHPTYIVVMNIGSEIEYADILSIRPTIPETLTVYTSSANSPLNPGARVESDKIMLKPKEALTLTTVDLTIVNLSINNKEHFDSSLSFEHLMANSSLNWHINESDEWEEDEENY